ncbi:hypothetical protein LTS18_002549 [Coniosporium uncinatum]|uniref:Uncharacterized protein n=1 Tax=Coniosporium uncinatum TaxID=93489 RepID=A0ACC3D890_9PEZI|nr:hypothetical protein LTS18_002549 [Coniosporium uncinatum]
MSEPPLLSAQTPRTPVLQHRIQQASTPQDRNILRSAKCPTTINSLDKALLSSNRTQAWQDPSAVRLTHLLSASSRPPTPLTLFKLTRPSPILQLRTKELCCPHPTHPATLSTNTPQLTSEATPSNAARSAPNPPDPTTPPPTNAGASRPPRHFPTKSPSSSQTRTMPIQPNSSTWTVRLKHHKTTIVLHIDPLQTLASLKEDLLLALQQTCTHQTLRGKQLPSAAGAFAIAKPRDPLDVARGWERLPAGKKADRESVKAAGLRDNAVLAFRWDEKGKKAVMGGEEEGDGDEGLGLDGDGREGEEWDVVLPSFEDQYGVENEGDLGMQREFNG